MAAPPSFQYMSPPAGNRSGQPRLRCSYTIRGDASDRHKFGINGLAISADGTKLFSAGRDAVLRAWDMEGDKFANPTYSHSFEDHIDWVNDVILTNDGRLISCSSDTMVKVWRADKPEEGQSNLLKTLAGSQDYVKALAYSAGHDLVAAAGLDKKVRVWRLDERYDLLGDCEGHKDSIYCLASGGPNSSLLFSGSTEKLIRIWEFRTQRRVFKLRGHTDNIRGLIAREDGKQLLSASSDGTLKLWDVGTQKCIKTYDMHEDAVWALAADRDFTRVYSGGRDKRVCATDLASGNYAVVAEMKAPVLSIKLMPNSQSVWVSTTQSTLECWKVDQLGSADMTAAVPLSSSPTAERTKMPDPFSSQPVAAITGGNGIIKHHIANNRRHVVTQDDAGFVQEWDITRGVKRRDLGQIDMDHYIETNQDQVSVPNWLTVDSKTGSLTVHLNQPQCFSAESHTSSMGFEDSELPDKKVNIGHIILKSLFYKMEDAERNRMNESQGEPSPEPQAPLEFEKRELPLFAFPESTPIIVTQTETGTPQLRTRVGDTQMISERGTFDLLPPWVFSAVLQNHLWAPDPPKFTFLMKPDEEDNLPEMPTGGAKLTAARILKIERVMAHVVNKLNLADSVPMDGDKPKYHEYMEICVNSQAVPHTMDLGSVRAFYWRNTGDDLVITYRRTKNFRPIASNGTPSLGKKKPGVRK